MKTTAGIALCCCGCLLAVAAGVGLYNSVLDSRELLLIAVLAAGVLLAGLGIGRLIGRPG